MSDHIYDSLSTAYMTVSREAYGRFKHSIANGAANNLVYTLPRTMRVVSHINHPGDPIVKAPLKELLYHAGFGEGTVMNELSFLGLDANLSVRIIVPVDLYHHEVGKLRLAGKL